MTLEHNIPLRGMVKVSKREYKTIRDIPNDDSWILITGKHEKNHVLNMIGEDPNNWSHGSIFARTYQGEYVDVLFFGGSVPKLTKNVTRIK